MRCVTCAQRGLTLLELLVVLAVAAVVLHLGVPVFQEFIQQQRRWLFAEELASGLRSARAEAIIRNRTVIVSPVNGSWANGWHTLVDESGRGLADPANPVIVKREGPWKITVSPTLHMQAQLAFDYLGTPRLPNRGALAGTFHLCEPSASEGHRRVVIARTGRVRVTREGPPTPLCPVSSAS